MEFDGRARPPRRGRAGCVATTCGGRDPSPSPQGREMGRELRRCISHGPHPHQCSAKAKRGQVIEIKTLISHVMETGYRRNEVGAVVPRDIINAFVCTYNGEEVFRAGLYPAIAANPFFSFFVTASESGKFEFKWTDDEGNVETASAEITVE